MIRTLIIFMTGVFVGQEYGNTIPNVKRKTYELYEYMKNTELYKKVENDLKNK